MRSSTSAVGSLPQQSRFLSISNDSGERRSQQLSRVVSVGMRGSNSPTLSKKQEFKHRETRLELGVQIVEHTPARQFSSKPTHLFNEYRKHVTRLKLTMPHACIYTQ